MGHRILIFGICLGISTFAYADTLEEYAKQCDLAIGPTVLDFNCDNGTLVPTDHLIPSNATYPNGSCDRPNQLKQECDPGSKFQVITNTPDAFVVAHCRKQSRSAGRFGDIAVIQHNRANGATCFYQALGDLDGNVMAPSKGTAGFWLTPASTAGIGCGGCHDNGPIIRSPYLSQINALPGAGDTTFNRDQPYYFVGADFASWKAYKVEVSDNICNSCHRMGVSNILVPMSPIPPGTARDFGIRATAAMQTNKNPHSDASPKWMPPNDHSWGPNSQVYADAAQAIKNCAEQFHENAPLPNTPTCKITQFTGATSDREEKKTSLAPIYYLLGM